MNYNNSYIYKLSCKDKNITDCYIGSTTNFEKRKRNHKKTCNNENDKHHHYKVYKFIRDNGGWNNWSMEIIEEINVNDKQDLHKLERKYIEQLNYSLNCNIPTRSKKEWREDNKEKVKEWRENNKEEIKEKDRLYREKNKEIIYEKAKVKIECDFCKSIVRKSVISRHRKTNKCIEARKNNVINNK